MASITTILGTDSVSSSRIVLNNIAALNGELANIASLFNTTSQTLSLTGQITGGSLSITNSGIEAFKVNNTEVISNVSATFTKEVVLNNALIHSVYYNAPTLPLAEAYTYTTYVLDANVLNTTNLLAAADNGQEITLIANGGTIVIDNTNIAGVVANISIADGGSVTLRYIANISKFFVIASYGTNLPYTPVI
jgi:hypothetical protein